jgi:cobalt-zinc-cadmium efflux system outer membrane protein
MRALLVLALAAATAADPPPLPLTDAVSQARAASPLRSAAAALAAGAAEAERHAGRLLNPLVEIRLENMGTAHDLLPYDIFATASQPIELAGKRALRRDLASADREVAQAGSHWTDRQLEMRTVTVYAQALRARGLVEALTSNRAGLATIVETTRLRVGEGLSAEADLLKFETEAARLDTELIRAHLDLARALALLTFTIGADQAIVASQLVEPLPVAVPTAAEATREVPDHPELAAAVARRRRAEQGAALERARRIPDAIITGGYKRTAGFDTGLASVMMSVPLFDANGSAAARSAGEARAAAADANAVAARLAAERTALVAAARALADRLRDIPAHLLQPAETVRNAARAEFREGRADPIKLVDAERVYVEVQRVALDLRIDALLAAVDARLALGLEMIP